MVKKPRPPHPLFFEAGDPGNGCIEIHLPQWETSVSRTEGLIARLWGGELNAASRYDAGEQTVVLYPNIEDSFRRELAQYSVSNLLFEKSGPDGIRFSAWMTQAQFWSLEQLRADSLSTVPKADIDAPFRVYITVKTEAQSPRPSAGTS